MNKFFFLAIIISFLSCNNKQAKSNINIEEDKIVQTNNDKQAKPNFVIDSIDKDLLNGIWAENEDDNALFEIEGDTIRYVEFYDTPYLLRLEDKYLNILLDEDYISKNEVLKIDKDSLVLKSEDGETVRLKRR
ncbi:hypothetical protein L0P88_08180 [Muricauda sp. SCSIO 64092]|uniref:hypothetical protein n=1 Tax=Allomuricauda sp. SCSIO 64092 TaxID=2908842 RepID=UPI001FF26B56|nr:hypothetical protein [Muricauda sp. SCSIO 64092]UOY08519.1 hypothetical protein L0P88_08180 [Muricauda sp. SCSIO 64092]